MKTNETTHELKTAIEKALVHMYNQDFTWAEKVLEEALWEHGFACPALPTYTERKDV